MSALAHTNNALEQSMREIVRSLPDYVMIPTEKQYFIDVMTLWPIDGYNIDQIAENQIHLSRCLTNALTLLRARQMPFERDFSKIKLEIIDKRQEESKTKLSDDMRRTITEGDPTCQELRSMIAQFDLFIEHIEISLKALDQRGRMTAEKSVNARRA